MERGGEVPFPFLHQGEVGQRRAMGRIGFKGAPEHRLCRINIPVCEMPFTDERQGAGMVGLQGQSAVQGGAGLRPFPPIAEVNAVAFMKVRDTGPKGDGLCQG